MREAVIVSTARTPLAKSWRGSFNMTHGATLGGHVVKHAIERAKIAPAEVEDVIWGCVQQTLEQVYNIGRFAAAGFTVAPRKSFGVPSSSLPARSRPRVRERAARSISEVVRSKTGLASG